MHDNIVVYNHTMEDELDNMEQGFDNTQADDDNRLGEKQGGEGFSAGAAEWLHENLPVIKGDPSSLAQEVSHITLRDQYSHHTTPRDQYRHSINHRDKFSSHISHMDQHSHHMNLEP